MNTLTATQILNFTKPSELFKMELASLDVQFKKLRSYWHPDKNKDAKAKDVFVKVTELHEEAFKILTGKMANSVLKVMCRKMERQFFYICKEPVDFGVAYYLNGSVIYEFEQDCEDLARNFVRNSKILSQSLKGRLETEFKPFLAMVEESFVADNDKTYVVVKIPKDHVPLSLLLSYYSGVVEPKHAAWMCSRMLNTAQLFNFAGLVSNSFSLSTYFVNPDTHTGTEIGGLAYATEKGEKLKALSTQAMAFYPSDLLYKKVADSKADIVLIKNTMAMLLGDAVGNGVALQSRKDVPTAIVTWIRSPPVSGKVLDEFTYWIEKVLTASFGKRVFTKMGISAADVFSKLGE